MKHLRKKIIRITIILLAILTIVIIYAYKKDILKFSNIEQTSNDVTKIEGDKIQSLSETPVEGMGFEDVSIEHYYYESIYWAVENNIAAGWAAEYFGVNEPCTRAEAITLMWRALGSPEPINKENEFTDVDEVDENGNRHWAYYPILWSVENGIMAEKEEGKFAPYEYCTRADMIIFVWNVMGQPEPVQEYDPFDDDVEDGSPEEKAVIWAVEKGITVVGYTNKVFAPENIITRGEMITFIRRVMED